jgi:hypothetical protein
MRNVFVGLVMGGVLCGCSEDSCLSSAGGGISQRVDAFGGWETTWLSVEDGIDVVWQESTSDEARAEWHAPSGLLDGASWGRFEDTLVLFDANGCRWLRAPDVHLVCSLHCPPPSGLQMLGHGRFESHDTLNSPASLSLLSTRSTAQVDLKLRTDSLAIRIPAGASSWVLSGAARRAGAYLSGLSQLTADELVTEQFQIHAATNRTQRIRATQYAFVNVAGTGDVQLHGQPVAWDEQNEGMGGRLVLMP